MNAFREGAIADHHVEEYKNKLHEYWRISNQIRLFPRGKTMLSILCKSIQC